MCPSMWPPGRAEPGRRKSAQLRSQQVLTDRTTADAGTGGLSRVMRPPRFRLHPRAPATETPHPGHPAAGKEARANPVGAGWGPSGRISGKGASQGAGAYLILARMNRPTCKMQVCPN